MRRIYATASNGSAIDFNRRYSDVRFPDLYWSSNCSDKVPRKKDDDTSNDERKVIWMMSTGFQNLNHFSPVVIILGNERRESRMGSSH